MAKTNSATSSAFVTGDTSGCMAPPTDPGATPDPAATPGGGEGTENKQKTGKS